MHKSSEHSNDSCVCNEDAPTVVSCAFWDYRNLWSSSAAVSFCAPPNHSDGKDTAMKINDSKKRNTFMYKRNPLLKKLKEKH